MKKRRFLAVGLIFVLAAILMTACGKSEFGVTENTEKKMKIVCENPEKDAFFMVGTLEVEDGEEVSITGDMSKGLVKVEIVGAPEGEHLEDEPNLEAEAILTANIDGSLEGDQTIAGTMNAGNYMVRATCEEKATGTILVEVKKAN
jgi:major membrane immunogen (membrane-anchored lipoprotein)